MASKEAKPTTADLFNLVARRANKHTVMQAHTTGEFLIWMTTEETDPVQALLAAAMSILIRRGGKLPSGKGVSLRHVTGVKAPGCDVHWTVTAADGRIVASGYAADEATAAHEMAPHLLK